jgi:hypothetical protein
MTALTETATQTPDMKVSVRQVFGIDSDLEVPAFSQSEEHVPDLDPDYLFDRETTLAILAGFARNRRVMITISSRSRPASTGPASASTWTATCPASTSSARMPSC